MQDKIKQFDEEIVEIITELISIRLDNQILYKEWVWIDIYDQIQLCHQALSQIEESDDGCLTLEEIEEGIRMARIDLEQFFA